MTDYRGKPNHKKSLSENDVLLKDLISNFTELGNSIYSEVQANTLYTVFSMGDDFYITASQRNPFQLDLYRVRDGMTSKIQPALWREMQLVSMKTSYMIAESESLLRFHADSYHDPYELKKAILALMMSQKVFQYKKEWIVHFNLSDQGFWCPSIIQEIDVDAEIIYDYKDVRFSYNGSMLLVTVRGTPCYMLDAHRSSPLFFVPTLPHNVVEAKLLLGFSAQDFILGMGMDESIGIPLIALLSGAAPLKKNEAESISHKIHVFRDNLEDPDGDLLGHYVIWNPVWKKGAIPRVGLSSAPHNSHFASRLFPIGEAEWNMMLSLPHTKPIISDIVFH